MVVFAFSTSQRSDGSEFVFSGKSMKFSVVRLISGVSDHFEHVVGVHLRVLLVNLLLDLLRDFLWLSVSL